MSNNAPSIIAMQFSSVLLNLFAFLSTASAAPTQTIEERHILEETFILPRQAQNIPQLLSLASLAGITLPTDPAALLSLAPVAANLQSYLPTSSVLSVLQTAAPPDFISNVVNDPVYAMSFQSAFAAGSSPSWFLNLPSDVKKYLHTYSGYGDVATAVGGIESANTGATSVATMTSSATSATGSGSRSASEDSRTSAGAQSTTPAEEPSSAGTRSIAPLAMGLAGAMGVLGFAIVL
ncbi:MAG: hypothetical protein L6R36_002421 [Xanthoria steineri]|nr:MAG: hypothetical protein L6R36_002421 [Xanthoria steineri]